MMRHVPSAMPRSLLCISTPCRFAIVRLQPATAVVISRHLPHPVNFGPATGPRLNRGAPPIGTTDPASRGRGFQAGTGGFPRTGNCLPAVAAVSSRSDYYQERGAHGG